ncbi:MAG: mycoredoxin [Blastocatellia bacterium]|jgi:mycoredoxin|nr:mycoredoxin [Blastocatellia bacterium]
MSKVIVYGADWCGDTRRTLRQLERRGVDHEYVDVEQDERASNWVKEQNGGKERKPTLKIGERVLSVPDERELEETLKAENLLGQAR